MNSMERTAWIEQQARAVGFDLCGVAAAEEWPELERLPEWLALGYAGEMRYLEDPRRRAPQAALAGARSVIVCALNYNAAQPSSISAPKTSTPSDVPLGWISRYAWGTDYHQVVGAKMEALVTAMRGEIAQAFDAKWYVDTGPVHERTAALHAGLGWIGKHTLLIHPEMGSWMFLGVILTTLDLAPSLADGASGANPNATAQSPLPDLCGQCTLCIDACPTSAIVEPYVLDARRCISYLTIELRGPIPEDLREPMGRHVFGCDICQDVCPWNRRAPITKEAAFAPREKLFSPDIEGLASLSEDEFKEVFRGSPVKRTKWRGLIRNACVALGNSRPQPGTQAHASAKTILVRLASANDSIIAEHARWALAQFAQ